MVALSVAVDTAKRLGAQTVNSATTDWRDAGLWGGSAGLAVLAAHLDAIEPGRGWDDVGLAHLRRAARGMERVPFPGIGLAGLAGLATAACLSSHKGKRYETLLTALDAAIVTRVQQIVEDVLRSRPHGVPVALFDVITGLAGAGRYLLRRTRSAACLRALEMLLEALVYLSETDAGLPHWHTSFDHSTENFRTLYPSGHVNLGMAHGIPGPLALLSLSSSNGIEVPGQKDAIVRIADQITRAQCRDEWGVGFPVAVASPEGACRRDQSKEPGAEFAPRPARSAWCYGAPGVARALWLAGAASGRSEYRELAVAAMMAVFERPIPSRRIDSPTLCHGVAGLLQITLRFERDGAGDTFAVAARALTAQLLDAHEPDSQFGYRDLKPTGQRTDNSGLLEGAAGVALVLLSAATAADPEWDCVLLLS